MSTYIRYETLLFFQSLCTGALLLLFYDLLRAFRAVVRHGGWWTAAEDLLYWVGVSIFGFAYVYQANQGILRSFLLLGLLLGAWICRFTISPLFLKLWIIILGIPVFIVKISIKRLLFLRERGKILLRSMEKSVSRREKDRILLRKRSKQVEKKKEKKSKKNSE